MTPDPNPTAEAIHRGVAFDQIQPKWNQPIERFEAIEHQLAVVLNRETAHLAGLALQGRDRDGVVKTGRQLVPPGRPSQIARQPELQLKPLALGALTIQHPDMGPEPQAPHVDPIGSAHNGRLRWLNCRIPLA